MYIGRSHAQGGFIKLDPIADQFDGIKTLFNASVGGTPFYASSPYSLLVSLDGIIQEPMTSFSIVENQITLAEAPPAGSTFFAVVLATTNSQVLSTISVGARVGSQTLDLHGKTMAIGTRGGSKIPVGFNLA